MRQTIKLWCNNCSLNSFLFLSQKKNSFLFLIYIYYHLVLYISSLLQFLDDDNKCYLEINYGFDIRKEWASTWAEKFTNEC